MALLALEGVYEDGKVELRERPDHVGRARVVVMFLPEPDVTRDDLQEAARQRAFARMKAGIDFGGEKFNREEIYEERMRELEARQDRTR